jgi:hypothetical protein
MSANQPYRFSQRSCERFTPHIRTIAAKYPHLCTFETGDLSVETFSCRLRDAMKALVQCKWFIKDFDLSKFDDIHRDLQVGIRDNYVIVGSRGSLQNTKTLTCDEVSPKNHGIQVVDPPDDILTALCILHQANILTQPTKIVGTYSESIASSYDVMLQIEPTFTLLI